MNRIYCRRSRENHTLIIFRCIERASHERAAAVIKNYEHSPNYPEAITTMQAQIKELQEIVARHDCAPILTGTSSLNGHHL